MKEITPLALHEKMAASGDVVLVDVREPAEHEEFNIGGINIPVTELPFRLEEVRQLGEGDIVLYCQSGNRSSLAQKLLSTQFNLNNTVNLAGGMKRWKEEVGE